jgi:precorrin-2 dehydrogenase / sirohydrochlorin ferrochelatase
VKNVYPLCLNISGRLCVIIGGGVVAERKVHGVLAASGRVRVISPVISSGLLMLVEQNRIDWRRKTYSVSDLDGAFLVFAATNNASVQEAIYRDAQAARVLVNIADAPALCDFQVPATLRRGDLTLSVATNGTSPAAAAMVRKRLEQEFGEEYALLIRLAGLLREQILAEERDSEQTKILFQKILHDDIVDWLRERRWEKIQQHLEGVLGRPVGHELEMLIRENP